MEKLSKAFKKHLNFEARKFKILKNQFKTSKFNFENPQSKTFPRQFQQQTTQPILTLTPTRLPKHQKRPKLLRSVELFANVAEFGINSMKKPQASKHRCFEVRERHPNKCSTDTNSTTRMEGAECANWSRGRGGAGRRQRKEGVSKSAKEFGR